MDEVGLYDPDRKPITTPATPRRTPPPPPIRLYNFSYIDQIYDGLLANHVRPFVELSFMPKKLASDPPRCTPSGTSRTSRRPTTTPSGTP